MSESELPSPGSETIVDDDDAPTLVHVTVDDDDAPAACTMYPEDCSGEAIVTRWITAHEGSYVALAEMR